MLIKNSVLCCLLFFISHPVFAQRISGHVQTTDKKPLNGVSISLLHAVDSSLAKVGVTDAAGAFSLEQLKGGKYLLVAGYVGYKKYTSTVITLKEQEVLAIILQPAESRLNEVSVTAKKPLIERKADRTIINVDAFISNAGSNALEVLEKTPGVQVDNNENIGLNGKASVLIFIDDKPTYLSGADLAGYLKSLPASSLDKIEIMTNPPAKYDAAGNGGIINIKTKRSKIKGFNGSISGSYAQGSYPKTNNSFNFNYRNNNINLFGSAGYALNKAYTDLDIQRLIRQDDGDLQTIFNQHSFIKRQNENGNLKVGLDYYVSPTATLGVVLKAMTTPTTTKILNTSKLSDATQKLDSFITADNLTKEKYRSGSINLNYRKQFDSSGRELTVDADYIRYTFHEDQLYKNGSFNADNSLKSKDILTGDLPSGIHIYSFKSDYAHPLQKNARLEAGIKTSYTTTDNMADYFRDGVPDYDITNHFKYDEYINAAYVNFNKEYKRISIQAGLRMENTISKGNQLGNPVKKDSSFSRHYTQLFPTAFISYKADSSGNHQFSFSYGRRIDRPYYQDLNPFVSPLDKFTYYVGNPFLQPQLSDNFELTYLFKNMLTTTVFFNSTKDGIGETIELVGTTYYSRSGNISSQKQVGATMNATLQPFKWWTALPNVMYVWNKTKSPLYTEYVNASGGFWMLAAVNQFALGKGWGAELSGNYRSEVTNGQFLLGEQWQASAGVSKKILNNKGVVKLNARDLFYTAINNGKIRSLRNGEGSWRNARDSRVVTVSFTYNFGKSAGGRKKHDEGGAESEQNRVKS